MAAWYYYTRGGGQIGPVSSEILKSLAKQGVISRDTIIENEQGVKRTAGSVGGLEFNVETYKVPDLLPASSHSGTSPTPPLFAEKLIDEPQFQPPNMPYSAEKLFLRFIYIFLAVFVGIFGIHDFYAKRNRAGFIHLALLSPYLIPLACSILAVPLWTIYAACYSPHLLEIAQHKSEIVAEDKAITDAEQKLTEKSKQLEELEKKYKDALDGKFKIQTPSDKPQERLAEKPQGQNRRRQWNEDKPQEQSPKRQWDEDKPQEQSPKRQWDESNSPDKYTLNELEKQMEILQDEISSIKGILNSSHSKISELTTRIANLEVDRKVLRFRNWLTAGELWIYFIFAVLPFFSWVMAMVEIVIVTKDGRGIELE